MTITIFSEAVVGNGGVLADGAEGSVPAVIGDYDDYQIIEFKKERQQCIPCETVVSYLLSVLDDSRRVAWVSGIYEHRLTVAA